MDKKFIEKWQEKFSTGGCEYCGAEYIEVPIDKIKAMLQEAGVEVNPATLDAYVGKYQLQIGPVVIVVREANKLMVEVPGMAKLELLPESETEFFLRAIGAEVIFEKDKSGKVIRFLLRQGSEETPAKRIEPLVLKPEQLKEYIGDYYSEELGTAFTLVVDQGKLIAQRRRNEDSVLSPTAMDEFAGSNWYFSKVQFTRAKNKRISGFRLSGSRVRNLRFDKK